MDNGEYKSRIDKLKKALYSRKAIDGFGIKKSILKPKDSDTKSDWEPPKKEEKTESIKADNGQIMTNREKTAFLNKFLIFSAVFVVAGAIFAIFSLGSGINKISSENIDINLSGPVSIGAGEVFSFEINIQNKNNVDLETSDLLIEYPDGTRAPDNVKEELKRYRKSLGTIKPGEKKQAVAEAILFGEEKSLKEIKVGIEYRVPGSNAIFFTERKYEVQINSSPISLSVFSPKEVNSGQEMEFIIEVRSNSEKPTGNLLLKAEYPSGFTPTKSEPKASFDDDTWKLGEISEGEKQTFSIKGKLEGQDDEERVFRFNVGVVSEKDDREIGVNFMAYSNSVTIKKSFIELNVALGGSVKSEYVAKIGENVRCDITWKNNLPSKIKNAVIQVKLNGEILDKSSVNAGSGFYNSSANNIVWDKRSLSELDTINSGDTGSAGFSFRASSDIANKTNMQNQEINIEISISGSGEEANISDEISVTSSRKVKISSNPTLNAKMVYSSGKFANSGPLPPKVGSETTYTVILSVSNLMNDIADAEVRAILPPYIRWINSTSPSDEKITYNPIGGEIKWKIGDIYAGTGYKTLPKEVQFQVGFTPSLSQVGSSPNVVEGVSLSGLDVFTDTTLKSKEFLLNTNLETDPAFDKKWGYVVR